MTITSRIVVCLLAVLPLAVPTGVAGQQPGLSTAGAPSGSGFYRPGEWAVVRFTVRNPTDQPQRLLSTFSVAPLNDVQFGTSLSLPPRSQRTYWQPIRVASGIADHLSAVDAEGLLLDAAAVPEHVLTRRDATVRLDHTRPTTAVIADETDNTQLNLAGLARRTTGLSRRSSYPLAQEMPALPEALGSLDTLVLSADRPAFDAAQIQALRSWILAGGRLWVLLDEVDEDFMRRLLREDWTIQAVDRVSLDRVAFDNTQGEPVAEFEQPVTQVRVLPGEFEVLHSVGGWPASLGRRIGRGGVLVTTLSAKAWSSPLGKSTAPLTVISDWFFAQPDAPPVAPDALDQFVTAQIGYGIVGRRPVTLLMAGYTGLLVVAGVGLMRARRLEYLAAVAAGTAVVAALSLVAMGAVNRRAIPQTVAVVQVVEVTPSQREAVVSGLMSVYSPHESEAQIRAHRGGVAWPDMKGQSGRLVRMIWNDDDKWGWQRLQLPSGAVRQTTIRQTLPLRGDVAATLRLAPEGVRVETVGLSERIDEAWLVTPHGRLPLDIGDGGDLVQRSGDADDGETSATPSHLARLRAQLMETLNNRAVDGPTLFAWAPGLDTGIGLALDAEHRDAALLVTRLQLAPPTPGQPFRVPAPLIAFRTAQPPGGGTTAPIFNALTRTWLASLEQDMDVTLRFEPPRELGSMGLNAARLTLDIRAPGRTLTVLGYRDGVPEAVAERESPSGTYDIEISGSNVTMSDDGALYLTLRIQSATPDPGTWEIRGVALELDGVTLPLTNGR